MIKCPKCGKEAPPEAAYCPYCGSKLRTDEINVEALRTRVEELRHNEKVWLFISAIGFALFALGVWLHSLTLTRYEWRGLTLYEVTYHPYADIATFFIIAGLIFFALCLAVSMYYSDQRSKLLKRLSRT
jgi:hypothetical protein